MMTKKELLKTLKEENITSIIIGGIALAMYNSPRVTMDIDLAIKILDVDKVIKLMYGKGYYLIKKVTEENATIAMFPENADDWVNENKSGSMTFIFLKEKPNENQIPFSKIDITTQIDFLFELCIPIIKLKQRAWKTKIDDIEILVASIEDLLTLKKNRPDKTSSDLVDIDYLQKLLNI